MAAAVFVSVGDPALAFFDIHDQQQRIRHVVIIDCLHDVADAVVWEDVGCVADGNDVVVDEAEECFGEGEADVFFAGGDGSGVGVAVAHGSVSLCVRMIR